MKQKLRKQLFVMLKHSMLSLLFFIPPLYAQQSTFSLPLKQTITRNFEQCGSSDAPRSELDHFCPRLEGAHLEGCCPPIFKDPPLQCRYAIYLSRGQVYLGQTSYQVCENGQTVSIPCCRIMQRGCYDQEVILPFKPRLLHRNKRCCFENCPAASYWRSPPAHPSISPSHELVTTGPNCTHTVLQECSIGSEENCQPNNPCPPPPAPPSPPTPVPGPSNPPPRPTPGAVNPSYPTPSPDPGPAPSSPTPEPNPPPAVDPSGS